MEQPSSKRYRRATDGAVAAEVLGTFVFTFSGTATVLAVHRLHPHTGFTVLDDVAISLAFAFGVLAAVYLVATTSGAHINPAVTIALATVGQFPWRVVPAYLAAQFAGGLLAALMDWFMFGSALRDQLLLGSTKPGTGVTWWTALVTEVVITLVLMTIVMATAVFEAAPGGATQSGLAIGLWVGAAIFLALPVSGGSLNPARTLGPDIVSGQFPFWWVYLIGPIVGAEAGAVLWQYVLAKGDKDTVESEAGHR